MIYSFMKFVVIGRAKYGDVKKAIRSKGNKERALHSVRFFKTGKGEYGEGDMFLGLTVPQQRAIAKQFADLPISEVEKLLASPYHEDRFTVLVILVEQYKKGDIESKERIVNFYLAHKERVNNWDLVDSSAPYILGEYLFDCPKECGILSELAYSDLLWDRRIAIISTLFLISRGRYAETLKCAKVLLNDKEDLIHKATGWALREVWKRSPEVAEKFLDQYADRMPRTMLRYSIERMPEPKRKKYLHGGKNKGESVKRASRFLK